ncbi:hypothetical protein GWG54_08395 [Natronococcus sp. JC468]|uniref:hypothetical protein n=1 Tax=Natronococcus sp. JC468 TaxID=1961921 RepID=UPI00143B0C27|nr:hypothetical protein [Natronococcus sp. JC468]NKE35839.1 hypothetical protein [Natronococcus sp. JC468]
MVRPRRLLPLLAALSWTATALAQLVVRTTTAERERIEWTERRNLFLLCSSLSTNALALATASRYARRFRRARRE